MHVAICIVGFRNAPDIVQCLAALEKSTHADFEIIICENGGAEAHSDLSRQLTGSLKQGQPVRAVLAPANLGYAGGVNVCIAETPEAEAWWVLNPDTIPDPCALEELVRKLGDGYDIVGGIMYHEDDRVESYGGRWRPWLARAESIGRGRRLDEPVDAREVEERLSYIPGGSMLAGRRFLTEAGTMRDDYFLYCEEVEWSLRGAANGLRLGFAPAARVLHNQGNTTGSGVEVKSRPKLPIYLDERNKLLVTRDRFPLRFPVAAIAALLLIVLRYGKARAWRQMGYGLRGWLAGMLNKRGPPGWLISG
jgi:GT2 family glycosyltransferase